jgi:hypothetical protein
MHPRRPFLDAQKSMAIACLTYLSFHVFAENHRSNDREIEARLREFCPICHRLMTITIALRSPGLISTATAFSMTNFLSSSQTILLSGKDLISIVQ